MRERPGELPLTGAGCDKAPMSDETLRQNFRDAEHQREDSEGQPEQAEFALAELGNVPSMSLVA